MRNVRNIRVCKGGQEVDQKRFYLAEIVPAPEVISDFKSDDDTAYQMLCVESQCQLNL